MREMKARLIDQRHFAELHNLARREDGGFIVGVGPCQLSGTVPMSFDRRSARFFSVFTFGYAHFTSQRMEAVSCKVS